MRALPSTARGCRRRAAMLPRLLQLALLALAPYRPAGDVYPGCSPPAAAVGYTSSSGLLSCFPDAAGVQPGLPGGGTITTCGLACSSGYFRPSTAPSGYNCLNTACATACKFSSGACVPDTSSLPAGCSPSATACQVAVPPTSATCADLSRANYSVLATDTGCGATACPPSILYTYASGATSVNGSLTCRSCSLPSSPLASDGTPYIAAYDVAVNGAGNPVNALFGCGNGYYGPSVVNRTCATASASAAADAGGGSWLPDKNVNCTACGKPPSPIGGNPPTPSSILTAGSSPTSPMFQADIECRTGYYGGRITYRCCSKDGVWRSGIVAADGNRPGCWGNTTAGQCAPCPPAPVYNGTTALRVDAAVVLLTCSPGLFNNASATGGTSGVIIMSMSCQTTAPLGSNPWTTPQPSVDVCTPCSTPPSPQYMQPVPQTQLTASGKLYAQSYSCTLGYYGTAPRYSYCCAGDGIWKTYDAALPVSQTTLAGTLANATRDTACMSANPLSNVQCLECPAPPANPNTTFLQPGIIEYIRPDSVPPAGPNSVTFRCKAGYYQQAPMASNCDRTATTAATAWSPISNVDPVTGQVPCTPCTRPLLPYGTSVTYGPIKSRVTNGPYQMGVGCDLGFSGETNVTVYCCPIDGQWRTNECSGKLVSDVCGACPAPPAAPAFASVLALGVTGAVTGGASTVGAATALYQCDPGYYGGLQLLNCSAAAPTTGTNTSVNPWGSPSLTCKVCPAPPPAPANTTQKDIVSNGVVVRTEYLCEPGFFGTKATTSCDRAAKLTTYPWTPSNVSTTCQGCVLPVSPAGAARYTPPTFTPTGFPYAGVWSCEERGRYGGLNVTFQCCATDGSWGNTPDGCVTPGQGAKLDSFCTPCQEPDRATGTKISNRFYYNGTESLLFRVDMTCSEGYYYTNASEYGKALTTTCQNAATNAIDAWSPVDASSMCATCTYPDLPDGTTVNTTVVGYWNTPYQQYLSCLKGYYGRDSMFQCCGRDGSWRSNCSDPSSVIQNATVCDVCPLPPYSPPNTSPPTLETVTYGNITRLYAATWACNQGYYGDPATSECLTSASAPNPWSPIAPSACSSQCVLPLNPGSPTDSIALDPGMATAVTSPPKNASFSCQLGYTGGVNVQFFCCPRDGQWYLGSAPADATTCKSDKGLQAEVNVTAFCSHCISHLPDEPPKGARVVRTFRTEVTNLLYKIEFQCKPGFINYPNKWNTTCLPEFRANYSEKIDPGMFGDLYKPTMLDTAWKDYKKYKCYLCEPPEDTRALLVRAVPLMPIKEGNATLYPYTCRAGFHERPRLNFSCCVANNSYWEDGDCYSPKIKLDDYCRKCPDVPQPGLNDNMTVAVTTYGADTWPALLTAMFTPAEYADEAKAYPYIAEYTCKKGFYGMEPQYSRCNPEEPLDNQTWSRYTLNDTNRCLPCPLPPGGFPEKNMVLQSVDDTGTGYYYCNPGYYSQLLPASCNPRAIAKPPPATPWLPPDGNCTACRLPVSTDAYKVERVVQNSTGGTPIMVNITCAEGYYGPPRTFRCCQLDGMYYRPQDGFSEYACPINSTAAKVGLPNRLELLQDGTTAFFPGGADPDKDGLQPLTSDVCKKCDKSQVATIAPFAFPLVLDDYTKTAKGVVTQVAFRCDAGSWEKRSMKIFATCDYNSNGTVPWVISALDPSYLARAFFTCTPCHRPGQGGPVGGEPFPIGANYTGTFAFDGPALNGDQQYPTLFDGGCIPGYYGSPARRFTCCHEDGLFRDSTSGCGNGTLYKDLQCQTCPAPPATPANAIMEMLEFGGDPRTTNGSQSIVTKVRYKCADGFDGPPPRTLTCTSTTPIGQDPWGSLGDFKCSKCSDPPEVPGPLVERTINGNTATYSCITGYYGKPDTSTCRVGIDTTWSNLLPSVTCTACTMPYSPGNTTSVAKETLPDGAIASIISVCSAGWYGRARPTTLYCCGSDGYFYTKAGCSGTNLADLCAACPAPPPATDDTGSVAVAVVAKGYDATTGYTPPYIASYECRAGYFNSSATRVNATCNSTAVTANTAWNTTAIGRVDLTCAACTNPLPSYLGNPNLGAINFTTSLVAAPFGSPAAFYASCKEGTYGLAPNSTISCKSCDGKWKVGAENFNCGGSELSISTCTPCPAPPSSPSAAIVVNVTRTVPLGWFTTSPQPVVPVEALYSCAPGTFGTPIRAVCSANETTASLVWQPRVTAISCQACVAPDAPTGGSVTKVITTGSGNYPNVALVSCDGLGFMGGANVSYSCCSADGVFRAGADPCNDQNVDPVFQCNVCPYPTSPSPAYVLGTIYTVPPDVSNSLPERPYKADLSCAPGYYSVMTGAALATYCNQSATLSGPSKFYWTAPVGGCATCQLPAAPAGSMLLNVTTVTDGSGSNVTVKATFRCKDGYFGNVRSYSCCNGDGVWRTICPASPGDPIPAGSVNASVAFCSACPAPPANPAGTSPTLTYTYAPTGPANSSMPYIANYSCLPNYYASLTGTLSSLCRWQETANATAWSALTGNCTQAACNVPTPSNCSGLTLVSNGGTDATGSCNSGWYGGVGKRFSCCLADGVYRDTTNGCTGNAYSLYCFKCPTPPVLLGMVLRTTYTNGCGATYAAAYGCDTGYWGTTATVNATCNPATALPFPYDFGGSPWVAPPATTCKSCVLPAVPFNMRQVSVVNAGSNPVNWTLACVNGYYGGTGKYQCCSADGDWRATCPSGASYLTQCPACPALPPPPANAVLVNTTFGTIASGGLVYGASYMCAPGFYSTTGPVNVTCNAAATTDPWGIASLTAATGGAIPLNCTACPATPPSPPANAFLANLAFVDAANTVAANASYECAPGYWAKDLVSFCVSSRSGGDPWTPLSGSCEPCSVPTPQTASMLTGTLGSVSGISRNASFRCVDGFYSPTTTFTCSRLDGLWRNGSICATQSELGASTSAAAFAAAQQCVATSVDVASYCQECPPAPTGANGTHTFSRTTAWFDATTGRGPYKAVWSCDPGYWSVFDGRITSTCLYNASSGSTAWQPPAASGLNCTTCPTPNVVARNSTELVLLRGSPVTTRVDMGCKIGFYGGYTPVNPRIFSCCASQGTWTALDAPSCSSVASDQLQLFTCPVCPPPPPPSPPGVGYLASVTYAYPAASYGPYAATYKCAAGTFSQTGSVATASCLRETPATGNPWVVSGPLDCVQCSIPTLPPYVYVNMSTVDYGDPAGFNPIAVNLTCIDGYGVYGGTGRYRCCAADGIWRDGPDGCTGRRADKHCLPCGRPPPFPTLQALDSTIPYLVGHICGPGYYVNAYVIPGTNDPLSGDSMCDVSVTAASGDSPWTRPPLADYCKACAIPAYDYPIILANSTSGGPNVLQGDPSPNVLLSIRFTCADGFFPVGNGFDEMTCEPLMPSDWQWPRAYGGDCVDASAVTPSPTPSGSVTPSPSLSPTPSKTPSRSPIFKTPSVTPTPTPTSSSSVSPTVGWQLRSPSVSASPTRSASPSGTPSRTPSSTGSPSGTPTASPSTSLTVTVTPSSSATASMSSSVTPSGSRSATRSASMSGSPTGTPSRTGTPSTSPLISPSPSSSITPSGTPSASVSGSVTPSGSVSPSRPPTSSVTPSSSPSASVTPSMSSTVSSSVSASASVTASRSASPSGTASASGTPSASGSASASPSGTRSASASPTGMASTSISASATPSASASATSSATGTASPTGTASVSASPSGTSSATGSASVTASTSPSPSGSATASASLPPTSTPTPSSSTSATPSASASTSASMTPSTSPTASASCSLTPSGTPTPSSTVSPSSSASASLTASATRSVSPSSSSSASTSPSVSVSPSVTPSVSASPSATPSVSHTPSLTPTPYPSVAANLLGGSCKASASALGTALAGSMAAANGTGAGPRPFCAPLAVNQSVWRDARLQDPALAPAFTCSRPTTLAAFQALFPAAIAAALVSGSDAGLPFGRVAGDTCSLGCAANGQQLLGIPTWLCDFDGKWRQLRPVSASGVAGPSPTPGGPTGNATVACDSPSLGNPAAVPALCLPITPAAPAVIDVRGCGDSVSLTWTPSVVHWWATSPAIAPLLSATGSATAPAASFITAEQLAALRLLVSQPAQAYAGLAFAAVPVTALVASSSSNGSASNTTWPAPTPLPLTLKSTAKGGLDPVATKISAAYTGASLMPVAQSLVFLVAASSNASAGASTAQETTIVDLTATIPGLIQTAVAALRAAGAATAAGNASALALRSGSGPNGTATPVVLGVALFSLTSASQLSALVTTNASLASYIPPGVANMSGGLYATEALANASALVAAATLPATTVLRTSTVSLVSTNCSFAQTEIGVPSGISGSGASSVTDSGGSLIASGTAGVGRATARVTTLVLSDSLPPTPFTVTLPLSPSLGETIRIVCAAPASLASKGFVVIEPSTGIDVDINTPSRRAEFIAFAPFVRRAGLQIPPSSSFSIECKFTSSVVAAGGRSVFSALSSVTVRAVLLRTRWPMWDDVILEDVSVPTLRSVWSSLVLDTSARKEALDAAVAAGRSAPFDYDSVSATTPLNATLLRNLGSGLGVPSSPTLSDLVPLWQHPTISPELSLFAYEWPAILGAVSQSPTRFPAAPVIVATRRTNVTFVSDQSTWVGGGRAYASLRDIAAGEGGNGLTVYPGDDVALRPAVYVGDAEVPARVLWVANKGGVSLMRVELPAYEEVCPPAAAAGAGGCGRLRITVETKGTTADTEQRIATGREAVANIPFLVRGARMSCPPFCPGVGGGLLPVPMTVRTGSGANATSTLKIRALVPSSPPTDLSATDAFTREVLGIDGSALVSGSRRSLTVGPTSVPGVAAQLAAASASQTPTLHPSLSFPLPPVKLLTGSEPGSVWRGGIMYLLPCTNAQPDGTPYVDPASGVCLDDSDPRSAGCPLGEGDSCAPCPTGALCLGGAAYPRRGYWAAGSSAATISTIVKCAAPAGDRCPGWQWALARSSCGVGYTGWACSACASGYFPSVDTDGHRVCLPCSAAGGPSGGGASFGLVVLAAALVAGFISFVLWWARARKRAREHLVAFTVRLLLASWTGLQALAVVARAASREPGVPSPFRELLSLFGADGVLGLGDEAAGYCSSGSSPYSRLLSTATSSGPALLVLTVIALAWYTLRKRLSYIRRTIFGHGSGSGSSPMGSKPVAAEGTGKLAVYRRTAVRGLLAAWRFVPAALLTAILLFYGVTLVDMFSVFRCEDVTLPVHRYLGLVQSREALTSLLNDRPELSALDSPATAACLADPPPPPKPYADAASYYTSQILTARCGAAQPLLNALVQVSVLRADPGVVCGESAHSSAVAGAVLTLLIVGLAFPVALGFGFIRRLRLVAARDEKDMLTAPRKYLPSLPPLPFPRDGPAQLTLPRAYGTRGPRKPHQPAPCRRPTKPEAAAAVAARVPDRVWAAATLTFLGPPGSPIDSNPRVRADKWLAALTAREYTPTGAPAVLAHLGFLLLLAAVAGGDQRSLTPSSGHAAVKAFGLSALLLLHALFMVLRRPLRSSLRWVHLVLYGGAPVSAFLAAVIMGTGESRLAAYAEAGGKDIGPLTDGSATGAGVVWLLSLIVVLGLALPAAMWWAVISWQPDKHAPAKDADDSTDDDSGDSGTESDTGSEAEASPGTSPAPKAPGINLNPLMLRGLAAAPEADAEAKRAATVIAVGDHTDASFMVAANPLRGKPAAGAGKPAVPMPASSLMDDKANRVAFGVMRVGKPGAGSRTSTGQSNHAQALPSPGSGSRPHAAPSAASATSAGSSQTISGVNPLVARLPTFVAAASAQPPRGPRTPTPAAAAGGSNHHLAAGGLASAGGSNSTLVTGVPDALLMSPLVQAAAAAQASRSRAAPLPGLSTPSTPASPAASAVIGKPAGRPPGTPTAVAAAAISMPPGAIEPDTAPAVAVATSPPPTSVPVLAASPPAAALPGKLTRSGSVPLDMY